MRIKIGDRWFEATPEQPVMIELTAADRTNIGGMLPTATRYAIFDDADPRSIAEKSRWLDDGADCSCPPGQICRTPFCHRLPEPRK